MFLNSLDRSRIARAVAKSERQPMDLRNRKTPRRIASTGAGGGVERTVFPIQILSKDASGAYIAEYYSDLFETVKGSGYFVPVQLDSSVEAPENYRTIGLFVQAAALAGEEA